MLKFIKKDGTAAFEMNTEKDEINFLDKDIEKEFKEKTILSDADKKRIQENKNKEEEE